MWQHRRLWKNVWSIWQHEHILYILETNQYNRFFRKDLSVKMTSERLSGLLFYVIDRLTIHLCIYTLLYQ